MSDALQWIGCVTGLLGAFLLATNTRRSGLGFYAYLLSNAAWLGYAVEAHVLGLFFMQVGFTATSVLGVLRWRRGPAVFAPAKTAPTTGGKGRG